MYLMNAAGTEYRKVDHTSTLEQELSMDVEIDTLGCGLNGAVYYSEMLMDGGKARDGNQGAPYGTGYIHRRTRTYTIVHTFARTHFCT